MGPENEKKMLFSEPEIDVAVKNVAQAIISDFDHAQLPEIALIGIQKQGVPFAQRIRSHIQDETDAEMLFGTIDISMYRDDIGLRRYLPAIQETVIPFDLTEQIIILVDDVLYTGRTIRAALDALTDYGRPQLIRLAVLVDRGLREFPIQADYTGLTCKIPEKHKVKVHFSEDEGQEVDGIYEINKL